MQASESQRSGALTPHSRTQLHVAWEQFCGADISFGPCRPQARVYQLELLELAKNRNVRAGAVPCLAANLCPTGAKNIGLCGQFLCHVDGLLT